MLVPPVAALVAMAVTSSMPRGVPGEWEWAVPHGAPEPSGLALAALAIVAYTLFAWVGHRAMASSASASSRLPWLIALAPAGLVVQVGLMAAAPNGYGLSKWATLGLSGSSGYFATADREIDDPITFWSQYPTWVQGQDTLHIGTHPPGLLLTSHAFLKVMERSPGLAKATLDVTPRTIVLAMRLLVDPSTPRSRFAALIAFGALTLALAVLAAVPVYLLARATGAGPGGSWAAASFWPIVPSLVLFHPTADTVYPLVSGLSLALAAASIRSRLGTAASVFSGASLGVGMQYSLAFAPVGLIAGLIVLLDRGEGVRWRSRIRSIAGIGAGFAAVTISLWALSRANPLVIWWFNARNHHLFYDEYPRRLLAWLVANPIETAVGLGWPIVVLATLGLRRSTPAMITLVVLIALTLSGRNLGEVGRLWIVFFPPLVAATAPTFDSLARPRLWLVIALLLLSAEVLALQTAVQVVYPV
jgi:hypothetical protein